MSPEAPMVGELVELHSWARATGATIVIVAEDWESITYEARTTIGGEQVRRRCRDVLPLETALRRWEGTYVIGLLHMAGDGARCHHVRRVIAPCVHSPEEPARAHAVVIASALVERDRRHVCGATAACLRTYLAEPAADWRPW